MTATESYENKQTLINKELGTLRTKLSLHADLIKKNPGNWGYDGDLGHILQLLRELNEFIHTL